MYDKIGAILLGGVILYLIIYIIGIFVLYSSARKVRTCSRGIKALRFQTYNNTWRKYVKKLNDRVI